MPATRGCRNSAIQADHALDELPGEFPKSLPPMSAALTLGWRPDYNSQYMHEELQLVRLKRSG